MVPQAVCLDPYPLQVVEALTVLVHSDAELDVATHLQLSLESTCQYPTSVRRRAEILTETWAGPRPATFTQTGGPR